MASVTHLLVNNKNYIALSLKNSYFEIPMKRR